MPIRVLVVDDNPDSLVITRGILEPKGYEVIEATSGPQALALVEQSPPDVVLLDIMMPGMSGLEVLQQLKERYETARIPVILVTAKTADEDVVQGYQSGADYYITKPFTGTQLLYGIELVLGRENSCD
ncbi:Transcriptional regulatory protein WalR [bacterium HR30]|nr:Transcriptional regulatory protein WalR [bacterium HR30]